MDKLFPNAEQFERMINKIAIFSNNKPVDDFSDAPGGKHLVAGNKNVGFYGFVKPSEFKTFNGDETKPFNGNNLASAIGIAGGTPLFSDTQWLKFSYRGKVQFIPMKPLRYGVSWDEIYRRGAVYGTNTIGSLPPGGRAGSHLSINASDKSLNTIPTNDDFLYVDPDNSSIKKGEVASVGDTVKIEGFTNTVNNGDYVVSAITKTKITLAVPEGKTLITENGNPKVRVYKPANTVNQNAQVTIGGFKYKVRLIGGSEKDPRENYDKDRDTANSEWNNLLLPLSIKTQTGWENPGFAIDAPDWGIGLTDIDLHTNTKVVAQLGAYSWTANSTNESTFKRVLRGYNGIEHAFDNRSWFENSSLGWRPVLELIENTHSGYVSL